MERKNLIEPDQFGDHPNAHFNYFYHIWYDFKYTENALHACTNLIITGFALVWMVPQEVTS